MFDVAEIAPGEGRSKVARQVTFNSGNSIGRPGVDTVRSMARVGAVKLPKVGDIVRVRFVGKKGAYYENVRITAVPAKGRAVQITRNGKNVMLPLSVVSK